MGFSGYARAERPSADNALVEDGSDDVLELPVTEDLSGLRRQVRASHVLARLSPERRPDLVLAISEAATNALRYDQAPRWLRLWGTSRGVVAEVSGRGRMDEPVGERRRPSPRALHGWGLWLIEQLCDLVEVDQTAGKVRLRMHMRGQ